MNYCGYSITYSLDLKCVIMKKMLIVLPLFVWFLTAIAKSAIDPPTLEIGAKAPDFSLPGVDGKTYSLNDFRSHDVLVIVFTCNHCPTAQAYEDRIMKLTADYKSRGVGLVAISPNDPESVRLDELGYTDLGDSFEDMKIRAEDKGFNFPYLFDGETSEVAVKYGPKTTPHVFVFDSDRMLRYTGRIDDGEKPGTAKIHDTRNAIDALLKGGEVPVQKTPSFGCSVKWPDKKEDAARAMKRWEEEPVSIGELSMDGLKELLKNEGVEYKLINVWATWCGPCVTEFPHLIEMNRMYRHREFELITISLDDIDRKDKALYFLNKKHASMTNYIFSGGDKYAFIEAIDKSWDGALPLTLIVAPGGEVVFRKMGAIDPLETKRAVVENIGRVY